MEVALELYEKAKSVPGTDKEITSMHNAFQDATNESKQVHAGKSELLFPQPKIKV